MTKRTSCTGARARLLCSTVIAGMAAFGTAQAQTPAPAAPAGPATVSEVIVTAQRREERLQDVPIAITAFTAERLQQQNINQSQDLQATVPSLVVGANGQGSRDSQTFTLRGQGATFQASPGVVVYMSEVPLPAPITLSQQGGPGNYVDLENLQVLAGPQGTLFGRNTTGGAILLVPRKPQNEFGGYIQAGLGNYDAQELEAVLNVPIIEGKLLMRVVGAYRDREGYTHDYQWVSSRSLFHW
jgi:iron complex outermembrane recepter protein